MPFVTYYLSKGDETIEYDIFVNYPPGLTKPLTDGYTVTKMIPDDQKQRK